MNFTVVVLAAGQGTRMHSDLPKVLQPLAGRPILAHVIDTARQLDPAGICVVYGHGGEQVRDAFPDQAIEWALQAEQLGTGHAMQQAMPAVDDSHVLLIVYGDVPLVTPATLHSLLSAASADKLAVLTADFDDPTGYGRIIRDIQGQVVGIVEEKDATADQRAIIETNSGLMACPAQLLAPWLGRLKADNSQGEYYLTDTVGCAVADGVPVVAVKAESSDEVMGINDRRQLAEAESILRGRMAGALLDAGVTLADPGRVDVRGTLRCGRDVHIDVNAVFEGQVELGDRVRIGPNAFIRDARIGDDTRVLPNTVIEEALIGKACAIGPYARVRPGAKLSDAAKLGNFVEVKKSEIGVGSKVNHLSYIGDTTIGADVNVGAGTITCNYDGANKHRTVIGDGASIGSGVMLVAPVEIGAGGTIGAGSTISKSTPPGELALERSKQIVVPGWKRPKKD